MKYGSVCSGIEAASVAWEPLGWEAQWFSEIEQFPSAVLAHRFPSVPNLGDMTKIHETQIFNDSTINLLVGGTPCQSFSVAGLRKGLADPRGNLMLTFLSLAQRKKPRWIVWENVPGVLSSNGGRDFGTFLQALAELGYGFAYRVLDAQYFGVAQRRRRVFVVGYLGDWRPAGAVLFESQSLQRDSKPSRAKRQETPTDAQGSVRTTSPDGRETIGTLRQRDYKGIGNDDLESGRGLAIEIKDNFGAVLEQKDVSCVGGNISPTITSKFKTGYGGPSGSLSEVGNMVYEQAAQPFAIQGNLIGREKGGPQGIGVSQDGGMYTMTKTDVYGVAHPIAVDTYNYTTNESTTQTIRSQNDTEHIGAVLEQKSVGALCARDYKGVGNQYVDEGKCIASPTTMAIRRLTPTECERLQGFPDGWTKIPYRNKPEEVCSDGPRYKACGNSMAVPVMRWIGQRIEMVEELLKEIS